MDVYRMEDNPDLFFEPAAHSNDFFEIFIFQNASGSISSNQKIYKIEAPCCFFTSPKQIKKCQINTKNIKGFYLVFQSNFLSTFFSDSFFTHRLPYFFNPHLPKILSLQQKDYQLLDLILGEIASEIKNYQPDSPHTIQSLLYFILLRLQRWYLQQYALPWQEASDNHAYAFKALLEDRPSIEKGVQYYANALKISRQHLNRILQKTFGSTAKEIIQLRLLEEIKTQLIYTKANVNELAVRFGYSETNNFIRFFKKHVKITPLQFRKKFQKNHFSQTIGHQNHNPTS